MGAGLTFFTDHFIHLLLSHHTVLFFFQLQTQSHLSQSIDFVLCRLREILVVAEEMAIDIPHIWLYLSELITPMLHEGGIPMGHLFKLVSVLHQLFKDKNEKYLQMMWTPSLGLYREISKPLIPLGKAGDLLVCILTLLCKEMVSSSVWLHKSSTVWDEKFSVNCINLNDT